MKRTLAQIAVFMFGLASCNFQTEKLKNERNSIEQSINDIPANKIEVIAFENCEYIIYKEDRASNAAYGFMAHKGNCSNPIHQCD